MPPVNILIKPASSACNMACSYCFYRDVAANRTDEFQGMLSLETMELVIDEGLKYADGSCTFMFQGGEPTLAGLEFYQQVVRLVAQKKKPDLEVYYSIQTNGYNLDDSWCAFFKENNFLVGVSLDGPADIHNFNRTDHSGKNTFNVVMHSLKLLKEHGVDHNILCVLTGKNARSINRIYRFFRQQEFEHIQFIPCLEPFGEARGSEGYHLSINEYGDFLIRIFDLWYRELLHGKYVSIRHIDNWIRILWGQCPESCGMIGHCSIQFVVEGDGGVYPCDFYVLDELRLGTVGVNSFSEMSNCKTAEDFLNQSYFVPNECSVCPYYVLCRNGCRRDRNMCPDGSLGQTYYCSAMKRFFDSRVEQLRHAAVLLSRYR